MHHKDEKHISLEIEGLYKKFSDDVTYNMLYGTMDLFSLKAKQRRSLRKHEFWVLNNISLKFYAGEICAIIGENGSGKTTLIRVLSSIYNHEHGKINSFDNSITPIFTVKGGINPVFTGRENIYLSGALYGMRKAEIDQKFDSIVEFSELEDAIDMPCGNYSSGMKARLGYAIAQATDPDILMIDEALAVGDISFRQKCFQNLEQLAHKQKKTILFVTNNHLKVEKLAERVILMKGGIVVMDTHDTELAMNYYSSDEYKNIKTPRLP